MAAAAALLRSVATKMAPAASPRLPARTDCGGLWFSTSTGSTLPPASFKVPETHNEKVSNGWDGFKAGIKEAAPNAACLLLFSGVAFAYFIVNPKLDRIQANHNAASILLEEIKQELERTHEALLDSRKKSQIEGRDDVGKQG